MGQKLQKHTTKIAKRARELANAGLNGVQIAEKLNAEGFTKRTGSPIKSVNVNATYLKGRFKRNYTRKTKPTITAAPTKSDELELITLILASKLDAQRKLTAITAISEGRV